MARISNNLHNRHNVYVLGAGFSRLRGLPLIYDFMTQMRDALEYHAKLDHREECQAIEDVLDFRLKASSAAYRVQIDLENIEELFSLASASVSPLESSIKLAIAATLDFSNHNSPRPNAHFSAPRSSFEPRSSWTSTENGIQPSSPMWTVPAYEYIVCALLDDWLAGNSRSENSFITFNYDTILEESLDALGVEYSLGFDEQGREKRSSKTNVLKLHGSVNWAMPKGSRTKIEVMKDYRAVVNAGLTPQIIPPTWKKDSRGAFDNIWSQ